MILGWLTQNILKLVVTGNCLKGIDRVTTIFLITNTYSKTANILAIVV